MLVQDLINAAMRSANIIASGETPQTSESSDALFTLNQMLDSWSAERLLIYTTPRTVLSLPANSTGSYEIGPGAADFPNVARPQKIESAGIIIQESGSTPVEIPVRVLTTKEWARNEVKAIQSPLPTAIYCDYGYPFSTIYTWPALDTGLDIALYMWQPLSSFANLTDTIQGMPPGFTEAIQYNLAGRLAMEYGQTLNPVMIQLALQLKDQLKAANPEVYLMRCDGFESGRSFNVYTGELY